MSFSKPITSHHELPIKAVIVFSLATTFISALALGIIYTQTHSLINLISNTDGAALTYVLSVSFSILCIALVKQELNKMRRLCWAEEIYEAQTMTTAGRFPTLQVEDDSPRSSRDSSLSVPFLIFSGEENEDSDTDTTPLIPKGLFSSGDSPPQSASPGPSTIVSPPASLLSSSASSQALSPAPSITIVSPSMSLSSTPLPGASPPSGASSSSSTGSPTITVFERDSLAITHSTGRPAPTPERGEGIRKFLPSILKDMVHQAAKFCMAVVNNWRKANKQPLLTEEESDFIINQARRIGKKIESEEIPEDPFQEFMHWFYGTQSIQTPFLLGRSDLMRLVINLFNAGRYDEARALLGRVGPVSANCRNINRSLLIKNALSELSTFRYGISTFSEYNQIPSVYQQTSIYQTTKTLFEQTMQELNSLIEDENLRKLAKSQVDLDGVAPLEAAFATIKVLESKMAELHKDYKAFVKGEKIRINAQIEIEQNALVAQKTKLGFDIKNKAVSDLDKQILKTKAKIQEIVAKKREKSEQTFKAESELGRLPPATAPDPKGLRKKAVENVEKFKKAEEDYAAQVDSQEAQLRKDYSALQAQRGKANEELTKIKAEIEPIEDRIDALTREKARLESTLKEMEEVSFGKLKSSVEEAISTMRKPIPSDVTDIEALEYGEALPVHDIAEIDHGKAMRLLARQIIPYFNALLREENFSGLFKQLSRILLLIQNASLAGLPRGDDAGYFERLEEEMNDNATKTSPGDQTTYLVIRRDAPSDLREGILKAISEAGGEVSPQKDKGRYKVTCPRPFANLMLPRKMPFPDPLGFAGSTIMSNFNAVTIGWRPVRAIVWKFDDKIKEQPGGFLLRPFFDIVQPEGGAHRAEILGAFETATPQLQRELLREGARGYLDPANMLGIFQEHLAHITRLLDPKMPLSVFEEERGRDIATQLKSAYPEVLAQLIFGYLYLKTMTEFFSPTQSTSSASSSSSSTSSGALPDRRAIASPSSTTASPKPSASSSSSSSTASSSSSTSSAAVTSPRLSSSSSSSPRDYSGPVLSPPINMAAAAILTPSGDDRKEVVDPRDSKDGLDV